MATNRNYSIRIIDDNTKTSYGTLVGFFFIFFIAPCIASIPAVIVSAISSSPVAGGITAAVAFFAALIIWFKYRSSSKEKAKSATKVIKISKNEYDNIRTFLEKYGSISTYVSYGDVARADKHFKARGLTEPYDKFLFIRVNSDDAKILPKEQKLILKIFGYEDKDDIIWFFPKDRKPLHVTYFEAKDGTRMMFRHGLYERDINFRAIELVDNECVLHVYGNYY